MIYIKNRKTMFDYPIPKKEYSVSFVVPAYNEGKSIEESLNHILDIAYSGVKEIIVVNDCSTDDTKKIVERMAKKHKKIRLVNNKKNLGNAAKAQNVGLKLARGEIVAVVDADSFPARDSIYKMVGFFDDSKVGAVTCPVLARNNKKFMEKLQALEYKTISFTRKLLEYVDSIYVTPGPLALYRKEALVGIGGFDEENLTQDIESTWAITAKGWQRKMSLSTYVTSNVPSKFMDWFRQRRRWNIGGLQCIFKYKKHFIKKGILGMFIIPLFIIGLVWGLVGLFLFSYLFVSNSISGLLFAKYTIETNTPLITFNEFYITPSFLNYLGVMIFLIEIIFLIFVLSVLKEKIFTKEKLIIIPSYLFVYLISYPIIMLESTVRYFLGFRKW
ncbi:glycosyltransferase family 2 protein [Candidatus Pacearchaeota archaeon]|nr:glycosyltransferase family 2 protein [Candidatus Pacearchaeota archaeon]